MKKLIWYLKLSNIKRKKFSGDFRNTSTNAWTFITVLLLASMVKNTGLSRIYVTMFNKSNNSQNAKELQK